MSLLGVCGWSNNQAGVKMSHISSWGAGTMTDPIVVNRDNPWLEGWYEAPPGRWMQASGTYSNAYSSSPFAGGFIRTYEFWEPSWNAVDDWQTPIRGDSLAGFNGYQTSGENGWLNWAVRSGNFVPGGLYAVALANANGPTPSTWFKLADDVIVLPVIAISWQVDNQDAGGASAQDFRTRASALFDFIPFQGSRTSNWPADWTTDPSSWPWSKHAADDPTAYYDPPDDIWSQCGIQFQVVRTFRFMKSNADIGCSEGGANLASYNDIGQRILAAVGASQWSLIFDELNPLVVNFAHVNCPYWFGNWVVNHKQVEIDRADLLPPSNVVAHELGHWLVGSGHHSSAQNLMAATPANAHGLTQSQCDAARTTARDMAARFRAYNEKIGRIRPGNPYTPLYPPGEDPVLLSSQNTCCETAGEKSRTLADLCLGAGGEILPDSKCTDCCQISEYPPNAAFRPLGDCPAPQLLPTAQCEAVCCAVAGRGGPQYSKVSRLACDTTPGAALVSMSYCEGPA